MKMFDFDLYKIKENLSLWGFGLLKIPLIFFVRPEIIKIDEWGSEIKIPLNHWTRNHLKSMYFGALAIGADVAGGLYAFKLIQESGANVQFVFKDFQAEFLKRPLSDVHFVCRDGKKIKKLVQVALESGERVNSKVNIVAYAPESSGKNPVARFKLTISLKLKN